MGSIFQFQSISNKIFKKKFNAKSKRDIRLGIIIKKESWDEKITYTPVLNFHLESENEKG
jgi:hypothetical protein